MVFKTFSIFGCSCILVVAVSCPAAGISDADWVSIGGGLPGIKGVVYAMVADDSGVLYAGGSFTIAGRTCANNIAKWDGSAWSALGSGTTGEVRALAVDGSHNLFAGGGFDSAGGVAASHIARWNGSVWSALGNGISASIYALALDASGNIHSPGTINDTTLSVFKWDGTAWKSIGNGIGTPLNRPGVDTKEDALVIDKSGNVFMAAHSTENRVMGPVRGHSSTVVRWDGGSWDTLAVWQNSLVGYSYTCLTLDNSGNLYAGGLFDTIGAVAAKNVARWDGRAWGALGSGTKFSDYSSFSGGSVAALAIDGSGNMHAGGEFTVAGGKVSAYIAQCRLKNTGILPHGGDKALMTYNPRCRTFRFYLMAPEKISCRIFSLSGQEVFGSSEFLPEGDHALRIHSVRLARGVYIVQAKAGKESMRFKMTVER